MPNTTTPSPAGCGRSSRTAEQNPYQSPRNQERSNAERSAYDINFWWAYAANASLVAANSLLFRYVEFVKLYQADYEIWLGWIVGIGMVGSLLMRLVQGSAIDRYGTRLIWVGSTCLFGLSCLGHLLVTEASHPGVFVLRIALSTGLAGAFGSSMVYVSRRVPPERMAEMVGTLGTSGFLGMVLGPLMGDALFRGGAGAWNVHLMFLLAAGLGFAAMLFCWLATRKQLPPFVHRRRPPVLWLLRRYNPGAVMVVGVAMGSALGVSTTYLADYTRELGIPDISVFFIVYAVSAFVTRVSIRRFSQVYGIRRMLLVGTTSQMLSFALFLLVKHEWQLAIPAAVGGFAHAFLFPGIIAGGGTAFPERYRGIGTTLMMGTVDLGILLGAPIAGQVLGFCRYQGLPAYPITFLTISAVLLVVTVFYAWRSHVAMRAT